MNKNLNKTTIEDFNWGDEVLTNAEKEERLEILASDAEEQEFIRLWLMQEEEDHILESMNEEMKKKVFGIFLDEIYKLERL